MYSAHSSLAPTAGFLRGGSGVFFLPLPPLPLAESPLSPWPALPSPAKLPLPLPAAGSWLGGAGGAGGPPVGATPSPLLPPRAMARTAAMALYAAIASASVLAAVMPCRAACRRFLLAAAR